MQQDEKNYITPPGFERLREELRHLRRAERPEVVDVVSWAAGNGDRSENGDYIYGKKRLREIDSRIRYLTKRLEIAEVVDPASRRIRSEFSSVRLSPMKTSMAMNAPSGSSALTKPRPTAAI